MKIAHLSIKNFRGISEASLLFPAHAVLIGDNNTGKSTIFEAIDLVMGPERLSRSSPIDEHDFFEGRYVDPAPASGQEANAEMAAPAETVAEPAGASEAVPVEAAAAALEGGMENAAPKAGPRIEITATITGLSAEQLARFVDFIEWWDVKGGKLVDGGTAEGVDAEHIVHALRVTFHGYYEPDEDDFAGETYFTRSLAESDNPERFRKRDKQHCGFLYLRALRTGSRALSLERGSLLDIILRLKEIRPHMWEETIAGLSDFDVASAPELGVSGVLQSINKALAKYVPHEWGVNPHLRVSALTREHLRKVVTAFIATSNGDHAAPYYRQGTGTINMLVLAMLSQIAEGKQNVIFAMEEPETAVPPYAQKRIVHELRKLSAQSLLTSHSPYVLEEFALAETVVLSRDIKGQMAQAFIELPESVKHKRYRQEFRTRFCEGLLARRVLLAEGATEASAFPVAARRLAELDSATYASLEALGICVIDAGSETQIADLANLYESIGKDTFALCDKQDDDGKKKIEAAVIELFMHDEKGFEALVLKNTTAAAVARFAAALAWPPHLQKKYPNPATDYVSALSDYFAWSKGNWGLADFLAQCTVAEIPSFIRDACAALKMHCQPPPAPAAAGVPATGEAVGG